VAALFAALAACCAPATAGAAVGDRYDLAGGCFEIGTAAGTIGVDGGGYRAGSGEAARFYLKATGLGRYMLRDDGGSLMAGGAGGGVSRVDRPSKSTEWVVHGAPGSALVAAPRTGGGRLAVTRGGGLEIGAKPRGRASLLRFEPATACSPYPEASPGASGEPPDPVNPDGTVFGFADTHLHVTADMRAGGRVIDGKVFDRFGITRALGRDARNHGPDGSADVTGNLLRTGLPFGTHDVHGWPTFAGWPVHDTNTHQQIYYRWLERMWMAGERIVVAQAVEDEPLCRIEPERSHSCDETHTIALEIRRLRALERYVDAQSGGPGEGWLRIVESPARARRVVERGKLAVVIGVESSDALGCSLPADCTRADVDRGLDRLQRLGVTSLFIAHWVDNGFAGAALEGGTKGVFINVFNEVETGHYFRSGPCPHPGQGEEVETLSPLEMQILSTFFPATAGLDPMPEYPPGRQCNVKGLTKLGAYLVRQMIARHMLIEVDHMSERARDRVLAIAGRRHYPLVSSHTGTGGAWTDGELRRLYRSGGFAAATPGQAPELADRIVGFRRFRDGDRHFGVGLGTDTGGFSSLPGPEDPPASISYPFDGYRSGISFRRQRTGERTFDLGVDGVAHYGLFADLLDEVGQEPDGPAAMRTLFRSAEAYLRMWERARSH
jgi:microsomal dipeptidase-like Zn-dependent dipeptidase